MKQFILTLLMALSITIHAKDKEFTVTASQPQAKIYVNGREVGQGSAKIKVPAYGSVKVEVKMEGFRKREVTYYNDSEHPKLDKFYTIELFPDEAYENSIPGANVANENITINTEKAEDKAWKVISEVVTNHFDILEVSDKSTGYIRTSWNVQNIGGKTIRTRVIIKGASSDSKASYKVKLVSEYSDGEDINVKNDESFKPWDRILKKYKDIVPELQDRLK
ncbi:MAG: hypothetical protein K0R26_1898 [Bacteroidota bacterium]|jgi:hypothetical protein|nr:hypothetical protein [Bacteroidota bacterium]